jgi:hypothetical protein
MKKIIISKNIGFNLYKIFILITYIIDLHKIYDNLLEGNLIFKILMSYPKNK